MVIVYHTDTGYTREYAQLLSRAERLRSYNLEEARQQLRSDSEVFFMGPLMGGGIKGLKEARTRYDVKGACGVGMSAPEPQVVESLAQKNATGSLPLFYLQGGWAPDRVGWFKRHAVELVTRPIRRALEEKGESRTPEEQVQLEFLIRGGSFVSLQNLRPIQDWLALQA